MPSQTAASASQSSGLRMVVSQNGYVRHWVGRASYTLHAFPERKTHSAESGLSASASSVSLHCVYRPTNSSRGSCNAEDRRSTSRSER